MTPEERRILEETARELARKLQDSIMRTSSRKELRVTLNPQPPQHPNCRSLYIQQVGRALRTTAGDANTVVSWESLSKIIGADTVKRIREVL